MAQIEGLNKQQILKQIFGFDTFRDGQEELIDQLLMGRDVLGIMPTGSGKSLCFAIPAVLHEGTALVISPLISLMKDQVEALQALNISAEFLNSSLSADEFGQVARAAGRGEIRLLYVSPERLDSPGFVQLANRIKLSAVIVDEAHCVSQWGQDFRPSYSRIREFVDRLATRPPVGAFTATATPRVQKDIQQLLGLRQPTVVKTGFDRPNLHYEVRKPRDKKQELKNILKTVGGQSGIVYCATRKAVDEVYAVLLREGLPVARYHAGLDDDTRMKSQEDFRCDHKPIVVATNALGMGIDKSNVSFVIHYNMPKDLESYTQEAGRAGRDGSPARCILLYAPGDVQTNLYLIENGRDLEEMDERTRQEVLSRDRERLRLMSQYCQSTRCLRGTILRYFGEDAPDNCGCCGNCEADFEQQDVTVDAQKIMSCVVRMNQRFGMAMVADVLRGSRQKRVRDLGFDRLPTHGVMCRDSAQRIRDLMEHLVGEGYLEMTSDRYPVLQLKPSAADVLRGEQKVTMQVRRKAVRAGIRQSDDEVNKELNEQLKKLRTEIARQQGVPAYIVFTDAALKAMCRQQPLNRKELLDVPGVGKVKLDRYGDLFLAVIRAYCDSPVQAGGSENLEDRDGTTGRTTVSDCTG